MVMVASADGGRRHRLEGGCLCGGVRYAIEAQPIDSGICHCRSCQRTGSATGLAFFGVPATGFHLVRGEPVLYASSAGVVRSFCGRCGSPLTYRSEDMPDALDVMTLSLDDPNAMPPQFHVWASEAVAWDHSDDALPVYPCAR